MAAGGESAETVRTPDEVIGLFSTKEEGHLYIHMYSVASGTVCFEDYGSELVLSFLRPFT